MGCKHCTCQSCTDERISLERKYIKVVLSLSTENRSSEEIQRNIDKESNEKKPSNYDILYAETPNNRAFSVKFKNWGGHRDSLRYRISLWKAKKNLLAQIKMITNKKGMIVANMDEDLLDYISGRY